MPPETIAWALEEFGHAELGDARRTKRLVRMAADAADTPSGVLAATFRSEGEREGAYRFVENSNIAWQDVGQASYRATARRCANERLVIVPVDGSTVGVGWATSTDHFGPVGSSSQGTRGVDWFRCIRRVTEAFEQECVNTQPWYQLDAGADFGEMLHWMFGKTDGRDFNHRGARR